MPESKQLVSCRVAIRVGGEELANRRFASPDEAASWILSTGAKLRSAIDGELMGKIAEKFMIDLAANAIEDGHSATLPIFVGSLKETEGKLLENVRNFESQTLVEFHAAAVKHGQARSKRRLVVRIAGTTAAALAIALAWVGLKKLPAAFDVEALGLQLLSGPPSNFAGAWRPANATDGCDSSRIEFKRAQFDFAAAGRIRTYNAYYDNPNTWTLNVEYSDGGVRVAQTYRLTEESGSLQLIAVTASDPDVQAAAKRLVGVRFVRCKVG
ncbi:MAG: hypothetical protein HY059_11845 [Proteobacteria bacterium]|nr:hypothetical protein [Pseudomonadota bacterium]